MKGIVIILFTITKENLGYPLRYRPRGADS